VPYRVRVETIAQDIGEPVKAQILGWLPSYGFPYVTSVHDKAALRDIFGTYFENRLSQDWLITRVYQIAKVDKRGVASVAWTEPNRLHTKGLGEYLLSKGQTTCVTVHSYGSTPMKRECIDNLEGRTLNIRDVINNSFPPTIADLSRIDVPMVPQHFNCRHVIAPSDAQLGQLPELSRNA